MNILELETQHEVLLESALYILIFVAVYLVLRSLSRKTFRWVFPILNSVLLTAFTVGCSGQFTLLLHEQALLFSELHHFHSQLHQNQSLNALLGDNRLLLVDVSHDLGLVPDPSLNASWRANQLVTDRQKLAQFLTSLNTQQDSAREFVNMVVCDLTFGASSGNSAQDSALQIALNDLNAQGKLLMAKSELEDTKSFSGEAAVNTDKLAGGSVDITKYYEEHFFSYRLFNPSPASSSDSTLSKDSAQSLVYVLYKKLDTLSTKPYQACPPKPKKHPSGLWTSATFVPDFWIDNEDVSRNTEGPKPQHKSVLHWLYRLFAKDDAEAGPRLGEASGRLRDNFFYLGQVTDTDTSQFGGRAAFLEQLRDNYHHCKRNIIFIGLFEDPERDMHETLIGPMHGSVLLLNMFMNLLAGSHLIGLGYLLYLLVGFWYVGYLLIQEPHHTHKHKPTRKHASSHKKLGTWEPLLNWVVDTVRNVGRYFVEKRAYLVTFLVLLGAIAFFNHLINLIIIGVYIVTVTEVFEQLYHQKSDHPE